MSRDRLVPLGPRECQFCKRRFKDGRGFVGHVTKCEWVTAGLGGPPPKANGRGRPRLTRRCVVYFAETTEGPHRVKIGHSSGGAKLRLTGIQPYSPVKLRLRSEWTGCITADEWDLHRMFADFRIHGEWFDGAIIERAETVLAERGRRRR